jgi:hypothetical protein
MIVRIARVKVGNRQAPQQQTETPPHQGGVSAFTETLPPVVPILWIEQAAATLNRTQYRNVIQQQICKLIEWKYVTYFQFVRKSMSHKSHQFNLKN